MTTLDQLIAYLADALAASLTGAGTRVEVDDVDLDLPLEARFGAGGALEASLPRGLMATGFDPPLGRLRFRLRRDEGPGAADAADSGGQVAGAGVTREEAA